MMSVLSLGAGVQSTAVALMSAVGELPKLDHAIFSDTGWEPKAVYLHLEWLTPKLEDAGIKVHVVRWRDIRDNFINGDDPTLHAPVFLKNADGSKGITHRSCTGRYKIEPVERKLAELIGKPKGARWPRTPVVEQWFGISRDEIQRVRVSQRPAIVYRYPLVKRAITRRGCLEWMESHGFPKPPRSACIGCPYRNDEEWRRLRDESPDDFADAVLVDRTMRQTKTGVLRGVPYLHDSLLPLDEAPLDRKARVVTGVQLDIELDGIGASECEGMCGV